MRHKFPPSQRLRATTFSFLWVAFRPRTGTGSQVFSSLSKRSRPRETRLLRFSPLCQTGYSKTGFYYSLEEVNRAKNENSRTLDSVRGSKASNKFL